MSVASHLQLVPPRAIDAPLAPFSTPVAEACDGNLEATLERVIEKIAPVWPLADYVAVNPYQGYGTEEWLAARRDLQRVSAGELLMPLEHYRTQFQEGRFTLADVDAAIDELLRDGVPGAGRLESCWIGSLLTGRAQWSDPPADEAGSARHPRFEPLAAVVDRYAGTEWSQILLEEIGKHCAAHYDQGQSAWVSPWKRRSLYQAWRSAALIDKRVELLGLSGFRAFVRRLPDDPTSAVAALLARLGVPASVQEFVLLAAAHAVLGWSSWAKFQRLAGERRGEQNDDFVGLLAMRLAYDAAVSERHRIEVAWSTLAACPNPATDGGPDGALLRYCLLRAAEIAYRRDLLSRLASDASPSGSRAAGADPSRKLARLVFCIDVRSERIRRALESCSAEIATSGFAGFFGIPMEFLPWGATQSSTRVPALLAPEIRVVERAADDKQAPGLLAKRAFVRAVRRAEKAFQNSAIGGFGFVETSGWRAGVRMLRRTLGFGGRPDDGRCDGLTNAERGASGPSRLRLDAPGLAPSRRLDLAHAILRNVGIAPEFPRLVVFCGHGTAVANNPLQAGLECGACGGHSGEANAQFAAALLNDADVRRGLAERGVDVPADTHFLAALHETTTDAITFFLADVPDSHATDVQSLQTVAHVAAGKARLERLPTLACRDDAELVRRGRDWSEVRPEWGLVGNAAFVIGPRELTRGARLDGRVFLHDYDHRSDLDGSTLELIMTAPLVVAQWINLQYYASTVDNAQYGCGTKTTHNVVGRFGLVAGGGGDLLTGLPVESLHDGTRWRHEPLRLQAVVAAPRQAIERVLAAHASLRAQIANGWLHLVALDEGRFFRFTRRGSWLPIRVAHAMEPRNEPLAPADAGGS
ncbi:MAG: DUF2309 domain-containing protein [Pirellulales bacterium]|nr:DUF2309 domain-containing protein [Pirellulales bacterium]